MKQNVLEKLGVKDRFKDLKQYLEEQKIEHIDYWFSLIIWKIVDPLNELVTPSQIQKRISRTTIENHTQNSEFENAGYFFLNLMEKLRKLDKDNEIPISTILLMISNIFKEQYKLICTQDILFLVIAFETIHLTNVLLIDETDNDEKNPKKNLSYHIYVNALRILFLRYIFSKTEKISDNS